MVQKSRQKVSKDQESGKVWKSSLNPHPGQHPWDRGPSKEPACSAPGHGPPSLQLTSRSAVKHVLNKPHSTEIIEGTSLNAVGATRIRE